VFLSSWPQSVCVFVADLRKVAAYPVSRPVPFGKWVAALFLWAIVPFKIVVSYRSCTCCGVAAEEAAFRLAVAASLLLWLPLSCLLQDLYAERAALYLLCVSCLSKAVGFLCVVYWTVLDLPFSAVEFYLRVWSLVLVLVTLNGGMKIPSLLWHNKISYWSMNWTFNWA